MEIILIKDIDRIGKAGDIKNVKDGFARNYLLPQKKAIIASSGNIATIERIKKAAENERMARDDEFGRLAALLTNTELNFVRKADENGHLFGSVSENHIVEALEEKEIKISKTNVILEKHIKELGEYEVKISFTPEIFADIKVTISTE